MKKKKLQMDFIFQLAITVNSRKRNGKADLQLRLDSDTIYASTYGKLN